MFMLVPNCKYLTKLKKNCKAIIEIAGELTEKKITDAERKKKERQVKKIFDKMRQAKPPPKNKVCVNLSKRLERFKDSMLTFPEVPGSDCHNNRAERQLRPVVLLRKNSFGNRTDKGAERYGNIATVIETARLQGHSPMEFMKQIIKPFADFASLAAMLA